MDIGAAEVLKELVAGHKLILWTLRSEAALAEAVEWFKENGIELYGSMRTRSRSPGAAAPRHTPTSTSMTPLSARINLIRWWL
jgi:hypothetical protein